MSSGVLNQKTSGFVHSSGVLKQKASGFGQCSDGTAIAQAHCPTE